jgi:hypothetical protein
LALAAIAIPARIISPPRNMPTRRPNRSATHAAAGAPQIAPLSSVRPIIMETWAGVHSVKGEDDRDLGSGCSTVECFLIMRHGQKSSHERAWWRVSVIRRVRQRRTIVSVRIRAKKCRENTEVEMERSPAPLRYIRGLDCCVQLRLPCVNYVIFPGQRRTFWTSF